MSTITGRRQRSLLLLLTALAFLLFFRTQTTLDKYSWNHDSNKRPGKLGPVNSTAVRVSSADSSIEFNEFEAPSASMANRSGVDPPRETISKDTASLIQTTNSRNHFHKWISFARTHNQTHNISRETSPYARTCKVGGSRALQPHRFPRETFINQRVPLPTALSEQLYVRTDIISSNLKLVWLGDSLAWQFHNLWADAMRASEIHPWCLGDCGSQDKDKDTDRGRQRQSRKNKGRLVYVSWLNEEGSPNGTNAGDAMAVYFRINNFLSNATQGIDWHRSDVQALLNEKPPLESAPLLNRLETSTTTKDVSTDSRYAIQQFDVLIYRVPLGWIESSNITRQSVVESIYATAAAFQVSNIILVTPHFMNNIQTMQELQDLYRVRKLFRQIVQEWDKMHDNDGQDDSKTRIRLVLFEFGEYTDRLMDSHARLIGTDKQNATTNQLERLSRDCYLYPPSIRQACGVPNVSPNACQCVRNLLSADGMHFCMNHMGGPMVATWACQMECFYKNDTTYSSLALQQCSRACHKQHLEFDQLA